MCVKLGRSHIDRHNCRPTVWTESPALSRTSDIHILGRSVWVQCSINPIVRTTSLTRTIDITILHQIGSVQSLMGRVDQVARQWAVCPRASGKSIVQWSHRSHVWVDKIYQSNFIMVHNGCVNFEHCTEPVLNTGSVCACHPIIKDVRLVRSAV